MPRPSLPERLGPCVTFAVLGFIACGGDVVQPESNPDPDPDPVEDPQVNAYLTELPAWTVFSPTRASQAFTATGDSTLVGNETVLNVTDFSVGEEGELVPALRYVCYTTPYSMTETPEEIVMFSPDREILWPGALIQGRSHRDGMGSLLALTISERSPVEISIPSLATADNFRTVDRPTLATVSSAIGSMIADATAAGVVAGGTIFFEQTVYHSSEQFAMSMGFSGSYFGFSASGSGSFSQNASETTVTAHFFQKMYEVVLAPPQTPGAFFATDFTQAALQQQVAADHIGPDNVPVYVSSVVYGRMMAFSFTSSASETDIRSTLQAAYNGIGSSAELNLSRKQVKILEESKITVLALGGDAQATIDVIRKGDWTLYFTDAAPLSSAVPLSYTFRDLNGEEAWVTESIDLGVKTCSLRPPTGETFEFLDPQQGTVPIDTPFETVVGDGRDDLLFNSRGVTLNEFFVGLSNGNGTFTEQAVVTHPESPSQGWPQYNMVVGDVNNDGKDDVVWSYAGNTVITYVGLSNGDGTFAFTPARVYPTPVGTGFRVLIGDVDGQNGEDLIWSKITTSIASTFVGLSDGAGDFTYLPTQSQNGYFCGSTATAIANMNGDALADIVWTAVSASCPGDWRNNTYVGLGSADGTFSWSPPTNHGGNWGNFSAGLVGDVNGDRFDDLVFAAPNISQHRIYSALNDSAGTVVIGPNQDVAAATLEDESDPMETLLLDVDGNGIKDLVWHTTASGVNRLYVGLGTSSGVFDFSRTNQEHLGSALWATYRVLVGDINGDRRDDIIWISEASPNTVVYVGLAIVVR